MITQEELKKFVSYDPLTGVFTWKVTKNGFAIVGKFAGHVNKLGYVEISLVGKKFKAHRLAWIYMTGSIGDFVIDHIDGNPSNNKFDNLRKASKSQNQFNAKKSKANTSGIKGVNFHKDTGKWQASIKFNGRSIYLGLFEDKLMAEKARKEACIKYHGEFHNHG